ncbi:PQQ-like beta-propeller repeat protein [Rosistilla oblonga]|uniref:PQQ enzyme repeat protein n=1 Tax=Rosistilla oblonga TaxID=2527990 RepID=A0A518IT32_9BACT|nr:PQQ-like beta-propeller repeat protein [Rosistilla oblonga]QDV56245.1 PQQ enzyme repeat protein [Rosistilla oblonga]
MLNETPHWSFYAKRPLTRWFEHVRLLTDKVVGQWFCLDRQTGAVLWERNLRPDEIVDITDGVIVANERRRHSFSSERYGCYGVLLDTGKLLWTSNSSGLWEGLRRLAGWMDCPIYVADQRVYCRSGRVLDVKSGDLLERVTKKCVEKPILPESETIILGRSKSLDDPVRLKVSEGLWLSHKLEAKENVDPTDEEFFKSVWDFHLFLTADDGEVRWKFDLANTGYEIRHCLYEEKCRYSFPFLYLLVCEKRTNKKEKSVEVYNPSQFHVLTLNVNTGQIIQDIRIFNEPKVQCRIEDIDEGGVLISDSDRKMLFFERIRTDQQS